MSTHPLSSRVGPVTWLLLQALSVVASILLAFAIDAWWDARTEGAEKNELLTAFRKELVQQREALKEELVYQRASRDNTKLLLAACAAGRYEDTDKKLDHRLADLMWFSSATVSSGVLDGLLQGGRVTAVEDETLRRTLTVWPSWISALEAVSSQEHETFTQVLLPFFPGIRHSPRSPTSATSTGGPVMDGARIRKRSWRWALPWTIPRCFAIRNLRGS